MNTPTCTYVMHKQSIQTICGLPCANCVFMFWPTIHGLSVHTVDPRLVQHNVGRHKQKALGNFYGPLWITFPMHGMLVGPGTIHGLLCKFVQGNPHIIQIQGLHIAYRSSRNFCSPKIHEIDDCVNKNFCGSSLLSKNYSLFACLIFVVWLISKNILTANISQTTVCILYMKK